MIYKLIIQIRHPIFESLYPRDVREMRNAGRGRRGKTGREEKAEDSGESIILSSISILREKKFYLKETFIVCLIEEFDTFFLRCHQKQYWILNWNVPSHPFGESEGDDRTKE